MGAFGGSQTMLVGAYKGWRTCVCVCVCVWWWWYGRFIMPMVRSLGAGGGEWFGGVMPHLWRKAVSHG